jgi:hypothetical protein
MKPTVMRWCPSVQMIHVPSPSYSFSSLHDIGQSLGRVPLGRARHILPKLYSKTKLLIIDYRLCGLVVGVPSYTYRVRFSALPDFLRSNGSGTGSTQPREDN